MPTSPSSAERQRSSSASGSRRGRGHWGSGGAGSPSLPDDDAYGESDVSTPLGQPRHMNQHGLQ